MDTFTLGSATVSGKCFIAKSAHPKLMPTIRYKNRQNIGPAEKCTGIDMNRFVIV